MRDFLPLIHHTAGDDAKPDDVFSGYLRHYEAAWTCFGDVEETSTEISRPPITTAVLTNGTKQQQHAKLQAVGLQRRLSHVFTAEDRGAAKPALSTYRDACEVPGVNVDRALHVGDQYPLNVMTTTGRSVSCSPRSNPRRPAR